MSEEKILTPAEVVRLQEFVLDVLNVVNFDDTGVTDDLAEGAEVAAEILGIKQLEQQNEDDLDAYEIEDPTAGY